LVINIGTSPNLEPNMTIYYVNTGSSPNAGNGDSLRVAFTKINQNFEYLSTLTNGSGSVDLSAVDQNIIPAVSNRYNLGSSLRKWNNAYLNGALYINSVPISISNTGSLLISGHSINGETGPQGPKGDQGIQGVQGLQGIQGIQGPIGNTGTQGVQGPVGSTGIQGPIGPQGPIGNTGTQGIQGPMGPEGAVGPQGIQGSVGPIGPQGIQGSTGTQGIQGVQGLQGIQGIQGVQGSTGTQGVQGIQGVNGVGFNPLTVTTPLTVSTGTLTLQVDLASTQTAYTPGMIVGVIALDSPNSAYGMGGIISSYTGNTLIVNVSYTIGTGSFSNWRVVIFGRVGPTGPTGQRGATGPQGISLVLIGSTGTVTTSTVGYGQPGQGWIGTSTGHVYFWNTLTVQWEDIGPIVGPQGDPGPQGIQGEQGIQGASGADGPIGLTGAQGPIGPQGIQGIQGIQGSIGIQGPQGSTGTQGIQGPIGLTGAQGDPGPQGSQGDPGPQGVQGVKGDKGDQGIQGEPGPQGIRGIQGIQGVKGDTGSQGIQGIQGIQGNTGTQGIQGPIGPKGDTGPAGETGPAGPQGPGADQGLNTTDSVQFNDLTLTNGDDRIGSNGFVQARFTYAGSTDYEHQIRTRHDDSEYANNAIDFYTNTSSSSEANPPVLGLTIANGQVGIGGITNPEYTLDVDGDIAGNNLVVKNNGSINFISSGTVITEARPGDSYSFTVDTVAVTGSGTGCRLNVQFGAGDTAYSVSVNNGGDYTYNVGDQLKVTGNLLGGATPANDLIVEVASLFFGNSGPYAVYDVTVVSGTPVSYLDGLHIQNNGHEWTFGQTGILNLPETTSAGNAIVQSIHNVQINSDGYSWTFGTDGNLTLPGYINGSPDKDLRIKSFGEFSGVRLQARLLDGTRKTQLEVYTDNVYINTNEGGYEWTFDNNGNLTLPNSTVIGTPFPDTSGIVTPIDTPFVVETSKSSVITATLISNPGTGATPRNGTGTAGVRYMLGGPGGDGVGMQVRFTSGGYAGGQILNLTDIEIIDPGTGYQTGDQLTILNGNNDCTFTIQVTPQLNNTWLFGTDSNLTTPGSIIPNANNTYNLGSPDRQWNHIYVSTGSIYIGGIKLSTQGNQLSVTQVTNIGGQETVVQNYALTNADRLVKDGQTLVLTTSTNGAAIVGVENAETDLIIGSIAQGLGIQSDGTIILSSGQDTGAPLILVGGYGMSQGQDGGDVLIIGGVSDSGLFGGVQIQGQYAEILSFDGLTIGNGDDNPWVFDNSDLGLVFPDETRQYTAYQGATIVSDTAPDNHLGRIWFNSVDGRAYVKYNDLWTDLSPQLIPAPETYLEGLVVEDTTITTVDSTSTINIKTGVDKVWTFGTDSKLVLPTGGDIVDSLGNSVLENNRPTDRLVSGVQTLILAGNADLLVPGSIRSISGGSAYINFSDYSATLQTTEGNIWSFDSLGTLTAPGNITMTPGGRFITDGTPVNGTSYTGARWYNFPNVDNQGILRVFSDEGTNEKASLTLDNLADVSIRTTSNANGLSSGVYNKWSFGGNGGLVFPDATVQNTAYQGSTLVSDTAPSNDLGRIWFNSTDGRAYVKYNNNWVDLSPQVIPSPDTYLDNLRVDGSTISNIDSTGTISIDGDLLPAQGGTYDLGSPDMPWKSLYVGTSTIYLGPNPISVNNNGTLTVNGAPISSLANGDNQINLDADGALVLTNGGQISNYANPRNIISLNPTQGGGSNLLGSGQWGWSQMLWVDTLTGLTSSDIDEGPTGVQAFNWAYVDANGFRVENVDASGEGRTWDFSTDGTLNLPESTSGGNAIIQTTAPINLQVNSNANIWTFGTDGELALPTNGYTEAVIKEYNSTALVLFAQSTGGNIKLLAGATSAPSAKQWLFNGTTGALMFPDNTNQTTAFNPTTGTGYDFKVPITFSNLVTFSNTATYVQSTNTVYTDNLIEIHAPPGGVPGTWSSTDGRDIGIRMHYYNNGDKNAALVLAQDTKYLEWYSEGTEVNNVFTGTYGTFKTGSIIATGVVTATTFVGNLTGNLTGVATTATTAITAQVAVTPAYNNSSTAIATTEFVGQSVPKGVIWMWNSTAASIPTGFQLCDGTNGTPDLRDRFIIGAGSTYSPGNTGGTATVTLSTANLPAHSHNATFTGSPLSSTHSHNVNISDPGHGHYTGSSDGIGSSRGGGDGGNKEMADDWNAGNGPRVYTNTVGTGITATTDSQSFSGTPAGTVTVSNAGSGTAVNILPKYYALCYIQKMF
jgi:hypothetical protein